MARVLGRDEARERFTARGSRMLFKAVGADDDGDLSVMERSLPPGGQQPPPHRHATCSEAFFVLAGHVRITVATEQHMLGPEDFLLVPRGTAHTFGNPGDDAARLLVIHAPAMDAYFAGLHELWNGVEPPTPEQERELMTRFGLDPV